MFQALQKITLSFISPLLSSLTIIFGTILVRPASVPMEESPPSQQLLQDAQDFLDGLGLIPPMGYSPDMMREDSLPPWTPSPLSFLPPIEDHPWAPALRPLPLITPEMEWVSYYFLL